MYKNLPFLLFVLFQLDFQVIPLFLISVWRNSEFETEEGDYMRNY